MAEALLEVRELVKSFGGITVTAGLSLSILPREVHAVIGPNGAGKTTLIAQIAGELSPDAGTIWFAGRNITPLPVHQRAALGLARSFQITSIFQRLSVLDNVALAIQARQGHSFHFWPSTRRNAALHTSARAILERVGLAERAEVIAGRLSYGEQRQLEIAMVLGTQPRLLLLDEPTAGMAAEESARMVALLRELKADHALLLVEHDMDAVFALADRITVLVYGHVIASGAPDAIRSHPQVQTAYLGGDESKVIHA
jgi:branched-chain amino acid transport system ATP-binding protein